MNRDLRSLFLIRKKMDWYKSKPGYNQKFWTLPDPCDYCYYTIVCDYINGESGETWVSQSTLAKDTQVIPGYG